MSNLYPPILESQRDSIASKGLPVDSFFDIYFTMPLSVVTAEIGHVQVLLRRQVNMDPWSTQTRPVQVPEKETIYLPGFKGSNIAHDTGNCLEQVGGDLWKVAVPAFLIRGITSVGGGDTGEPGFPAGGVNQEGETFTVQLRFGDSPLEFASPSEFADWKRQQTVYSLFGEWSNAQRMFVYALPQGAAEIGDMFSVSVLNDPIARLEWQYTPVSEDPLTQVRLSYSWSVPDRLANNFRSKNLSFQSNSGRDCAASGKADFGVMRFTGLIVVLEFITANNTRYQWIADADNLKMPAFNFVGDPAVQGYLQRFPLIGDELEDGSLAMTFQWHWAPAVFGGRCEIYRVDTQTLETVLLRTIEQPQDVAEGDSFDITIRDYSVEMGEDYLYFGVLHSENGEDIVPLYWPDVDEEGHHILDIATWQPHMYPGFVNNRNFNGNTFLTTKWQQLKLQGNTILSQFKRNVSEQFTSTIGGEYPVYSRSSKANYRSFSLSSLITIDFDDTHTFFKLVTPDNDSKSHLGAAMNAAAKRYRRDIDEMDRGSKDFENEAALRLAQYYLEISEIARGIEPISGMPLVGHDVTPYWMEGEAWYRDNLDVERRILKSSDLFSPDQITMALRRVKQRRSGAEKFIQSGVQDDTQGALTIFDDSLAINSTPLRYTQDYSKTIYAERKFREEVMKWLSDGKPKLIRSETEGNMIVILSGVSFTPLNNTRLVYSFNATVTEIAEYNLENLILYDLVPNEFSAFYIPSVDFSFLPGADDPTFYHWYRYTHKYLRRFWHETLGYRRNDYMGGII